MPETMLLKDVMYWDPNQ